MALEAVVYQKGLFGHYDDNKDFYSLQENWNWDLINFTKGEQEENNGYLGYIENRYDQDPSELSSLLMVPSFSNEWRTTPESSEAMEAPEKSIATASTRQKRRRVRSKKNKEEIENQRMTHIAVERNRRKQMNEYLSVLKSLMPDSYVQRSDQASIVGGAINYVKELEQNLHFLSTRKTPAGGSTSALPFQEFFSFPQYSTMTDSVVGDDSQNETSSFADVEVSMVESHANLKIRSKKHPKQLLKLVSGLQCLRLSILHLNVSTIDQFALYSISVKVEDGSNLTSVDEVATAVHQLIGRIQEEARV